MPSLWDATSIYWLAKSFSNCSTTFSKVSGLHCSSKKYTVQDTTEIFLPPESNRYSPDRTGVPIWYLYYFYDIFWIYGKGRGKDQCQLLMQKTGWTNHSAFQSGHSSSLVWSSLVWSCLEKEFCLWLWSHGCSQQPCSCRQGNFDMVTTKGTTRRTLSRPAFDPWEGSLLKKKTIICKSCVYCTLTHYEYNK